MLQTNKPNAAPEVSGWNNRFEVAGDVWLVTPMLRDAEAGHFGEPLVLPIWPFREAIAWCTVEREKVERFKDNLTVLTKPVLIWQDDYGHMRKLFDGRHRLTALLETGWSHFSAWSVPPNVVTNYALAPELLVRAADWLVASAMADITPLSDAR